MISHIVFDLGGVLVRLDGSPINPQWAVDEDFADQGWQRWISSPTVQRFDRGEISVLAFSKRIIKEIPLDVDVAEFIEWFRSWPRDFFPGIFPLLDKLKENYQLGVLSNTTELHWPKYYTRLKDHGAVSHFFASYLMGLAKPDPAAFEYMVSKMRVKPSSILYIDDNLINVDAAKSLGIRAFRAQGPIEINQQLLDLDLLSHSHSVALQSAVNTLS